MIKFHCLKWLWLWLLEILGNIFIAIIFCPVYDVTNFEIKHSLFIKPFFCITKNFQKKKILVVANRKKRTSLLLFYIRICVSTKFQLELTILVFSKNFTQKRYFLSKTEKSNLKMKFWMIKLVYNHWKNLRLTLVFMWSSALREVFNFCFSRAFC